MLAYIIKMTQEQMNQGRLQTLIFTTFPAITYTKCCMLVNPQHSILEFFFQKGRSLQLRFQEHFLKQC